MTGKLCIDCKHCSVWSPNLSASEIHSHARCVRPSLVSKVTGRKVPDANATCEDQRQFRYIGWKQACGPDGKFWEAKE